MSTDAPSSVLSVLTRIYWMMIGPAILFLLLLSNFSDRGGWFTTSDIAYLIAVMALVGARWLDFHQVNPQTAMGTPATRKEIERYSLVVTGLALSLWVIANLVSSR